MTKTRAEIKAEIIEALEAVGITYEQNKIAIIPFGDKRAVVQVNGERHGIWDSDNKEFEGGDEL